MASGTAMNNKNILEIALDMQQEKGWLSWEDVSAIAEIKGIPASMAYETLSFYSMIRLEEPAKVLIEICRGTSCYIAEGTDLLKELTQVTGCPIGGKSGDGKYQIEYCECLGHCETAPNIIVNGKLYLSVTKDSIKSILKEAE